MTFDFCFATYQSAKWLRGCVQALAATEYDHKQLGLYFADNASTDTTLSELERLRDEYGSRFGAFSILRGVRNDGFGAASNRAARAGSGDYVFFLNVDTEIHPDALTELECAIRTAPETAGGFELRQEPYEFPKYYDPTTMQTNWISGAAFVMPRALFEETGGFDERIFMYCEDVDLSWNIRSRGRTLHHVPKAAVTHYSGDVKAPPKRLALIYSAAGNAFLRLKYGSEEQIREIEQITDQYAQVCGEDLRAVWQMQRQVERIRSLRDELEQEKRVRPVFTPELRGMDFQWRRAGYDYKLSRARRPLNVSAVVLPRTYEPGWESRALYTLSAQTCPPAEVLVITPDASDRSLEQQFPELPVRVIVSPDAATRAGVLQLARKEARGDYCLFVCDEAYLFADHLETMAHEAEKEPDADLLCCGTLEVLPDDKASDLAEPNLHSAKSVAGDHWLNLSTLMDPAADFCKSSAVLISRRLWESVGNIPESAGVYDMQLFWLSCLIKGKVRFVDRDGVVCRSLDASRRWDRARRIGQTQILDFRKALDKLHAEMTLGEIARCCAKASDRTKKQSEEQYAALAAHAQHLQNALNAPRPRNRLFQAVRARCKQNRILAKPYEILAHVRYEGVRGAQAWLKKVLYLKSNFVINELHVQRFVSAEGLIAQKEQMKQFPQKEIAFWLLPGKANAEELRLAIESLQNQTAERWLLLADPAGMTEEQRAVFDRKAASDKRIRAAAVREIPEVSCEFLTTLGGRDFLHPSALYHIQHALSDTSAQILYTDEQEFLEYDQKFLRARCKPDYAPDTFLGHPYLHNLTLVRSELVNTEGLEPEEPLFWDRVCLRCIRGVKTVAHVPYALYYTRVDSDDTASESRVWAKAVEEILSQECPGAHAEPLSGTKRAAVRVRWPLAESTPMVSIIIQNKDQRDLLKLCVDSIFAAQGAVVRFEILIVENNSSQDETFAYYRELEEKHSNVHVLTWDKPWNYSALNNFAAEHAKGRYFLFLNNDIQVLTHGWLEELLTYAQRSDVGAVGAKMYYTDGEVQHGGVIVGLNGSAGHSHRFAYKTSTGYDDQLAIALDLSAVTGACLLMTRETFDEVGGFDEELAVALNDVDICLKIREHGKLIVFDPVVELLHDESKSRGSDSWGTKLVRNQYEVGIFLRRWADILDSGDPYYSPNLCFDERYVPDVKPIPEVVQG